MSRLLNGSYRCDKCGAHLENGRAEVCTRVVGRHPDNPLQLRQLEYCVEPRDGAPFGCTGSIIGPAALTHYEENPQ